MKTNDAAMIHELETNTTGTVRARLYELIKVYDLCKLGEEVHQSEVDEIITQVLRENDFRAVHGYKSRGCADAPSVGDRVLSEDWTCALSETDFARLMDLCVPRWHAAGLTDENGTSTPAWTVKKIDARRELLDFIIDTIIPSALRPDFRNGRHNFSVMEKLIETTRGLVA